MRERRGSRREPGALPLLIAVLTDRPNLPGAACIGRHELFDLAVHPEDRRTASAQARFAAARLCGTCPHTSTCGDSLAAPERRTA